MISRVFGSQLGCLLIGLSFTTLSNAQQGKKLPRVHNKVPFPEVIRTQTTEQKIISLRLAIKDIETDHGEKYPGEKYLHELKSIESIQQADTQKTALDALQKRALLANPSLDFNSLVLVRRHLGKNRDRTSMGRNIGMPGGNFSSMWNSKRNLNTEIGTISNIKTKPTYQPIFQAEKKQLISDIDLHFTGGRIMFSAPNKNGAYRLFEIDTTGSNLKQLSPDTDGRDVDHFDSCYLPDGDIIFTSTATFCGMPCIDGKPRMSSIYRLTPSTGKIRQLSFDQDSSWCPTVMNDGRVLYLRWEYSDLPHSNSRILMTMHPDGSSQKSYLFTNSYFPTSFFYARPIPGDPTKVVGIATGHHGNSRTGRMLLVDPQLGEHEADGVIQEIPGHGKKVDPIVRDRLADGIWPQNTQPYPIAESGTNKGAGKYFLVSMKPSPEALWGIYLVDIFDNRVLIMEQEEHGFFEPIPLKKTTTPPILTSHLNPSKSTASVYIQDIYHGPGLKGIPRGTVKALRVCSYEFSPSSPTPGYGSGGLLGTIGMDGPWDIKKVIGVVPVNSDGSAHFTIPANTPIFLLPIDENGQALQIMRSWFIGQPGERVSCIGCHESSHASPIPKGTIASRKEPVPLKQWIEKVTNFSFATDVQPILDQKCISCHDGKPSNGRYTTDREEYAEKLIPYLGPELLKDWKVRYSGSAHPSYGGRFSESYYQLFRLVRGPGIESDMRLLTPKEFSADSTELVQMLKKGHHGVKLTKSEWQTLYRWIDFNTPYHGNRMDIVKGLPVEAGVKKGMQRSNELAAKHSAYRKPFGHHNPPPPQRAKPNPIPNLTKEAKIRKQGTIPFHAEADSGTQDPILLDLGNGQSIKLVYIPAGSFVMGSSHGPLDELPMHKQHIKQGFWMAEGEITNAQMRQFFPEHDSRDEDRQGYQFGQRCYDTNQNHLPAVRVSWDQAMDFCAWLSKKSGKKVTLPTEIQWEWACRAKTATPFWFGKHGTDFSPFSNLADISLQQYVECTGRGKYSYFHITRIPNPNRYEAYTPAINSANDGGFLAQTPKKYRPNPWGLYDMHGNVAEWTRSDYSPYPASSQLDTSNSLRTVRGGSWRDRPHRATSSHRLGYPHYQKVYNVGFRIIIEP